VHDVGGKGVVLRLGQNLHDEGEGAEPAKLPVEGLSPRASVRADVRRR
jgi:hypothetical protein